MSKWKIYTPEGVQDILFKDCFMKRNLEQKIRGIFRSYGYQELETPTLEFYDCFAGDADMTPQETMFKFFDPQGRILVLRPDLTVPVARVAATKFKEAEGPFKFSYIGNAFRFDELGGGKQKEFTQAGVEILGSNTPEADAEIIVTAIHTTQSCGLENFQIDIGQVEFFKGLMEETGLTEEEVEQVRILIDSKDYLAVEELVKSHAIREDLQELILSLPGLFGSIEVIDRVEKMTVNPRALKALQNLRAILEIIYDYGLGQYVSIDLGMVQSLNYYTGIIFRGFTYGIGFPILSGGRYDNLVEKFGRKCPATGFSVGINMVMMALDRQKIAVEGPSIDSLICYRPEGRKTAFEICNELRRQGLVIDLDVSGEQVDSIKTYASGRGIGGIIYVIDSESIEMYNLISGEVQKTSVKDLMNK